MELYSNDFINYEYTCRKRYEYVKKQVSRNNFM